MSYLPLLETNGKHDQSVYTESNDGEKAPNEHLTEKFSRSAVKLQGHTDYLGMSALILFVSADCHRQTERNDGQQSQADLQKE